MLHPIHNDGVPYLEITGNSSFLAKNFLYTYMTKVSLVSYSDHEISTFNDTFYDPLIPPYMDKSMVYGLDMYYKMFETYDFICGTDGNFLQKCRFEVFLDIMASQNMVILEIINGNY